MAWDVYRYQDMRTTETMAAGNALGIIGGIIRNCIREMRTRAGYYDNTREGLVQFWANGYQGRLGYTEGAPHATPYGRLDV